MKDCEFDVIEIPKEFAPFEDARVEFVGDPKSCGCNLYRVCNLLPGEIGTAMYIDYGDNRAGVLWDSPDIPYDHTAVYASDIKIISERDGQRNDEQIG